MQRNNGSVVCLSALRLEKKRKRGCKAARARGRATRGGGKRERERVPRTFFHATGTNERAKSPRQRSFDDVCFFPKARMISDAFFLVVVRCFKKATYFYSHFLSHEFYLRKCVLETPQIKKNTERAPKGDVKVVIVLVFVVVSIPVLLNSCCFIKSYINVLFSVQNLLETFVARNLFRQSALLVLFVIGDEFQQVQVGFFD